MSCKLPRCCAIVALLLILGAFDAGVRAQAPASSPAPRTFTDRSGRKIEAFFLGLEDGKVRIRRKDNGKTFDIELDTLSAADQAWVQMQASSVPARLSGGSGGESQSEIERATQLLCDQIVASYPAGKQTRIAVVEFSDLRGGVTDFGRLLAEELITGLFSQKYNVVERFLLNKAIEEHKLQLQGLVDPDSAKQLGKILGVDAIVTGTVADLGTSLRVNARLISTESGAVFSAAAVTIQKTPEVEQLMALQASRAPGTTATAPRAAPSASGQVSLADLGYQSAVLADLATSLKGDAIRKALESRFGTLHETEDAYFIRDAGPRNESAWVFAGGRILAASKRSLQDSKGFTQLVLTWTDVTGTIATVSADIQPADVRPKLESVGEVFTQEAQQYQMLRVVSPAATGWILDWPDAKPHWAEIVGEGSNNSYWPHKVVIDQQTVITNGTAQPLGQSLLKLQFGRHVLDVRPGRGAMRFEIAAYFPQPNGRIKLYDRSNQSTAQREVYSQPIANVTVPPPPQ